MNKKKLTIEKKIEGKFSKYTKYILINENNKKVAELTLEKDYTKDMLIYRMYDNKKILYLTNFITYNYYRNKGYGKYLITKIINRYKGKYDLIHLDAYPFKITKKGNVQYIPPSNGLKLNELTNFYQKIGFEIHNTNHKYKIMIMKLK